MDTGLDVFLKKEHRRFRKVRLGVLCNQASVNKSLTHISQLVLSKGLKLNVTCFLGPQHGIRGEKQDNMVESPDFTDPITGLPIFSLYAETRSPTPKMLDHFEVLIVDLQDIGTRIYTFMYTMENCMRAAKKEGKKVVILDRPNPINGKTTEGNVLNMAFSSFVGQQPMCTRHGMTMGELALLFNEEYGIGCDLEIIKLRGWKREQFADSWGQDFVPPSPNIPTLNSALVFPGCVHFEGTLVSEGRGTTKPFEWIGAPYIEADRLALVMNKKRMPGVFFRAIYFQPTYQKCKDQVCGGVQIHVTDRKKFNSFEAGVELLGAIAELYPAKLEWKKPPYEYEYSRMPIDLITGTDKLRRAIEEKKGITQFLEQSRKELALFRKTRAKYLLYK